MVLRVLIVDDNVDAADMLALYLEAMDYEFFVEYKSLSALERARQVFPAVCLLDIGLPEMDGNTLARELRRIPGMEKTVLVALTGYGQAQDREEAFAAGFDYHFVKPLDSVKLSALLAEIHKNLAISSAGQANFLPM